MEKLIFFVAIAVISMLHSWWKKRNGDSEEEAPSWPGQSQRRPPVAPPANRPASPPPSKAASWEEELRRILQGEEPARPAPPPVVVQQPPPPLPRAMTPRPAPAPRFEPVSQTDSDMATGWSANAPSMLDSAQAFLHGSMSEGEAAEHIKREHDQGALQRRFELRKQPSPEIRQAVALVRDRQSQRAAIMAGIVLGPSKAMEM